MYIGSNCDTLLREGDENVGTNPRVLEMIIILMVVEKIRHTR